MFTDILFHLERLASFVPLEIYVPAGSFLEEIIAPIPSPVIMTTAGSFAAAAAQPLSYLLVLALLAAVTKTIGALLFYVLSDKAEDVVLGRFGRYIGLSHKSVEHLGKHFSGGHKDDVILFLLRALPIVPSAPLSVLSGVLKLNRRTFIISTFLGNIIRSLCFLYLGYAGIATLTEGIESLESLVTVGVAGLVGLAVIYAYMHRGRLNRHAATSHHHAK